jgi:hypothetical protein
LPIEINKQYCPICKSEVHPYLRYPKYVCDNCFSQATDENQRKVTFENISFWGGCQGIYIDTQEKYDNNICYIQGHKCIANEARFGGVVIQKE